MGLPFFLPLVGLCTPRVHILAVWYWLDALLYRQCHIDFIRNPPDKLCNKYYTFFKEVDKPVPFLTFYCKNENLFVFFRLLSYPVTNFLCVALSRFLNIPIWNFNIFKELILNKLLFTFVFIADHWKELSLAVQQMPRSQKLTEMQRRKQPKKPLIVIQTHHHQKMTAPKQNQLKRNQLK